MRRDSGKSPSPLLSRPALYRGVYSRVARRLGVDPSYVSRVARGQRRSQKIEQALLNELRRLESASQ